MPGPPTCSSRAALLRNGSPLRSSRRNRQAILNALISCAELPRTRSVAGAPAAAVAWLGRALAEPPPPQSMAAVLLELGSAELRVASPDAATHLASALELIDDPTLIAMCARLLGNALTWQGAADRAVEALGSAIERVERSDRELALLLEADLTAHAQVANRHETRSAARKRLERHSTVSGATPAERLVLASLAFERARASETEREAVAHLQRAFANGRLAGRARARCPAHDLRIARRSARHGRARSRRFGAGANARRRTPARFDTGSRIRARAQRHRFDAPGRRRRGPRPTLGRHSSCSRNTTSRWGRHWRSAC